MDICLDLIVTMSNSKDLYVILGNQNSGKSTLMRHLSGWLKEKAQPQRLRLTDDGVLELTVFMRSQQEVPRRVDETLRRVGEASGTAVLISLWIDGRTEKGTYYPSGDTYLRALEDHHRIRSICVLSDGSALPESYSSWSDVIVLERAYDPMLNQMNQVAARVRDNWGWV